MRELPFKVWKARRTWVRSVPFSGASPRRTIAACASLMTSRASSMKMSRISTSSSRPVPPAGAGVGAGTGADTGIGGADGGDSAATASASSRRMASRAAGSAALRKVVCAPASRRASSGCSAA